MKRLNEVRARWFVHLNDKYVFNGSYINDVSLLASPKLSSVESGSYLDGNTRYCKPWQLSWLGL